MEIVVGITGASGAILGVRLLEVLNDIGGTKVHLVVSDGAKLALHNETNFSIKKDLYPLAYKVHDNSNLAAGISSGTYDTSGMIIIPTSMKTLSSIANGYADNLISRSADVCIKEGRKLVLVPREMPMSRLHLENLYKCAKYGCVIIPPMLTFYIPDIGIESQINHVVGRVLSQFGLKYEAMGSWKGA